MAATSTGTVVGYFSTEAQAENAVTALKAAGFQSNQIGVALASNDSGDAGYGSSTGTGMGSSTGMGSTGTMGSSSTGFTGHNTAESTGRAIGEKTHSAWDRFKNFFEGGSDVEPYADESARGSNISHEITGSTGYDAGRDYEYGPEDVSHSLSGLNVPEDRSRYFGHRFSSGSQGAVVTVTASGRETEAERILTESGGDVGNDTTGYDYNSTPTAAEGQRRIQLLGEVLRVQKDRISRGEVRIRKEVITEQQTIQVPVTREELVIERMPVSGTTQAAGAIGQDAEIRIPLTEEVASADKQTIVREEVAVGKRAVENVQQVGAEVRHEELNVEDTTADRERVR